MIDYSLIARSIAFYEKLGYVRVETPWFVTPEIMDITRPKGAQNTFQLNHNGKVMVASGEQSFLYQYAKGFLPKGKFQTITPCFRFESQDGQHSKGFIKNELIDTSDTSDKALREVMFNAKAFFYSISGREAKIKPTDEGFDLECQGIEIGSYGRRKCNFLEWIYGTGIAEPRCSYAMNL